MPRNACTRHPKDKVIEIPEGFRYCERCHHLVPPEMEIVEIIEETSLEAMTAEVNKGSLEIAKEAVEAEPVEETEALPEMIKEVLEAEIEVKESLEESPEETAPAEVVEPTEEEAVVPEPEEEVKVDNTAKREALLAQLAELEKTEE